MTESHEHRISSNDLRVVAFACAVCHAEVTLRLSDPEQAKWLAQKEHPTHPTWACWLCGAHFDSNLRGALQLLGAASAKLKEAKLEIIFRVPES